MRALALVFVFAIIAMPSMAEGKRFIVVESGDTLWKIAQHHNCEVARITRANRLKTNLIQPGQRLRLPRGCRARVTRRGGGSTAQPAVERQPRRPSPARGPARAGAALVEHVVVSGDTLGKLAKQYDTSVEDLQFRNAIEGTTIYAGQILLVAPNTGSSPRPLFGQSVGRPNNGKLVNATRLPNDGAYHIRRQNRAFGTNYTVHHIRRAARLVRRRFPRVHRLAVGDLSARSGGAITMHNSHQSGRDVDLGFYFKRRPRGYPSSFVNASRANLHFGATWLLLDALAATANTPSGVERMYISYETQKILYELARRNSVSAKRLEWMFQYPSGRHTSTGLIRHEPYHNDHVHVRFQCPQGDSACY